MMRHPLTLKAIAWWIAATTFTQLANATHPVADASAVMRTAKHYLAQARSGAQPDGIELAQRALGPWWTARTLPLDVMHLRSEIKRADHAFGSALADLRAYLKHRPRDAQAHLETATLLVTMGNPKAAEPHCAALRGLQATLPAALCDAQTMGVTGKSKDAAHKLESALVNHRHATNEVRGWGYTLLGELHARTNAVDGARRAFTLALLLLPRNEYARIAYADFLLAQDEPQAVMNLYPEPIETLHEAERVRVAIAALKLGRADAALIARSALTALQTAAKSEPRGHVREEAMFALHVQNDPKQAVALALRNWAIQREPIDAEILWLAGSRAGDTHAMRIAQRWYDDTGFERTVATPLARGAPGSF